MLWSQLGVQGSQGTGTASATPTRSTSEQQLDQWNQALRQSSIYQNFMRANGLPTDGRVNLSEAQQHALEQALRSAGIQIPAGMKIDNGGNLNQVNRLGRNVAIGGAIGAGALTGLGLAGIGPFSGLAGGTAATGATGLAADGTIPALTAGTGATGVGALGAGTGGVYGGSALAGTTGAVSGGLGSAVAGGGGGSLLNTILRYAVPSVGSIVNGYLGSRAANQAAETQARASQQAIDTTNNLVNNAIGRQGQLYDSARGSIADAYNQTAGTQANIYNQNAAAFSPYMQLGAGTLGNLSAMTGGGPISVPSMTFQPVQAPRFSAATVPTGMVTQAPTQNTLPAPTTPAPVETPTQGQTPTTQPESPQVQAQVASASSYRPGSLAGLASGEAMVTVKAPTGETRQMPLAQAREYVAHGAQIVS